MCSTFTELGMNDLTEYMLIPYLLTRPDKNPIEDSYRCIGFNLVVAYFVL
jgi:hypothetical protein